MPKLLLTAFLLPAFAIAETYQNAWIVPNGDIADLSQTFTSGVSLGLAWERLNDSVNDLWVTTFNYHEVQYSDLIAENMDISMPGTYTWTIQIPNSQITKSVKYVLRLKPAANPRDFYNISTNEISSPGFIVSPSSAASSRMTLASESPATPPPSTKSSSTASPVTSTSPTPTESAPTTQETLSTRAKTGIGIGVSLAAITLISVLAWFFFSHHKKDANQRAPEPTTHQPTEPKTHTQDMWQEIPNNRAHPSYRLAELPEAEAQTA